MIHRSFLPDNCNAKEAGRVLCFEMRGRQGECGSPVRRDCADRRGKVRESRRGYCFGEGAVCRWNLKELDVVLGLSLREPWVGFFGRKLT